MVRSTSARPSGGRPDTPEVPAKMTSSILPPRRDLAPCSPSTQEMASTTFDLPDPFGPTTHVMPGSKRSVVLAANDLNPRRVRLFRYTRASTPDGPCARRPGNGGNGIDRAPGARNVRTRSPRLYPP